MNRQQIIKWLIEHLGDIDLHPFLIQELIKLICGTGYEADFFKVFMSRLQYLSEHTMEATKHKEFENLGGGLFSMHIAGKGFNVRILYSFLPNADPTLLLCFYEREGKRKTDYTPHLEPAKARFKERMEVLDL